MKKSNVVVLRTDKQGAYNAILNSLDFFKAVLPRKPKKIAIKLNLCDYKYPLSGCVSDPLIVEQLIKCLIKIYGNVKISFVESDTAGRKVKFLWDGIGINALAQKYNIKLVNLSEEEAIKTKINGLILKAIDIPKTLAEADLFISHPKLKTHFYTKISCSLKNQFGCLPNIQKHKFHSKIDEVVADVNLAYKPTLTLVDGIVGLGGPGPISGIPKRFNLIVTSTDVVAADCVCAKILGFNPRFIGHIQKSYQQNIGNIQYNLIGNSLKHMNYNVEYPRMNYYLMKLNSLFKGEKTW